MFSSAALLLGLAGICIWHSPGVARGGDDPPGAYKADSPDPTAAETLVLEYVNRCRANPAEDAVRCIENPGTTFPYMIPAYVDRKMFQREMSEFKPVPPLVFNLALLKAARWHSYYQVLHGMTHYEEAGKQGFTANDTQTRLHLAGFDLKQGEAAGENVFCSVQQGRSEQLPSLWSSHLIFVVDWGAAHMTGEGALGAGGMQPERLHRHNILDSRYRLAGVGVIWPKAQDLAVTHEFGSGSRRMLGGVVFNDRKRSRFYDIGEGVGDVVISTGTAKTKSWKSGAYAVELPESEAKITVELEGEKYTCPLPDGNDNVKFDVIVSDLPVFKRGRKLLEAAKRVPEDNKNVRLAALVDLHLATQDVLIEEGALKEITSLVEQVRKDLDKDMATVRQAVGGRAAEQAAKDVQAVARKYSHTKAKAWFNNAVSCLKMSAAYLRLKAMHESDKPMPASMLDRAVKSQQKAFAKLTVPEWRKVGMDLIEKTAALGGNGPPK
jgi:hypothetical protein